MGTLVVSRKQRLRKLEKEIRSRGEDIQEKFFLNGASLKEIKEDELWQEHKNGDGENLYKAFKDYCRVEWEWSAVHTGRLIKSAEYRRSLPSPNTAVLGGWKLVYVEQLARIPDKKQAARVAEQMINEIEINIEEAKEDRRAEHEKVQAKTATGGRRKSKKKKAKKKKKKPTKITRAVVRKYVDADLGIKRKPQKKTYYKPELSAFIDTIIGDIEDALAKMQKQGIPDDTWKFYLGKHRKSVDRLIDACYSMGEFMEDILRI